MNISADETILISHGSECLKPKSCAKPETTMSDEQQLPPMTVQDIHSHRPSICGIRILISSKKKVFVVTEPHFARSVC